MTIFKLKMEIKRRELNIGSTPASVYLREENKLFITQHESLQLLPEILHQ